MEGAEEMVVFSVGGQRVALPLAAVERVVRAVEVTPLPRAPALVGGVVNVQGMVVPVFDVGQSFGLGPRELDVNDQLILARTAHRMVALAVDEVIEIRKTAPEEVTPTTSILRVIPGLRGVVRCGEDMVLIEDLDGFLSAAEERELEEALMT